MVLNQKHDKSQTLTHVRILLLLQANMLFVRNGIFLHINFNLFLYASHKFLDDQTPFSLLKYSNLNLATLIKQEFSRRGNHMLFPTDFTTIKFNFSPAAAYYYPSYVAFQSQMSR